MSLVIPKVTVCIVVYNQEKYIAKCIQSVIDQETDFDVEILVGDDGSTDGSRAIISKFQTLYPGQVRAIMREKNIGPTRNYLSLHEQASGRFVAHLDGDDFALPDKLSKEVDYLESNPDCIGVVHKLAVVDETGRKVGNSWPKVFPCQKFGMSELVQYHPAFGPSSLMYRQGAYSGLLDRVQGEIIDYCSHIHLVAQGRIGVIDETLGLYTRGVGISSGRDLCEFAIRALEYGRSIGMDERHYRYGLARQYLLFAKQAFARGDFAAFQQQIAASCKSHHISVLQQLLGHYFVNPWLFRLGAGIHRWASRCGGPMWSNR
jgi:glycosyltransferase involved in cell wall biosynthesis